jgi:CheY-like chemotaxis protein
MPVMDGFEFLRAYEAQDKCDGSVSIYMLTSSQREEDRKAAMASKYVKGYLDKPLTAEDVSQLVSDLGIE